MLRATTVPTPSFAAYDVSSRSYNACSEGTDPRGCFPSVPGSDNIRQLTIESSPPLDSAPASKPVHELDAERGVTEGGHRMDDAVKEHASTDDLDCTL